VRACTTEALRQPGVDLIVTTGGTGIAPRDGTVEVARTLIDRPLDGFGELFRMVSSQPPILGPAPPRVGRPTFTTALSVPWCALYRRVCDLCAFVCLCGRACVYVCMCVCETVWSCLVYVCVCVSASRGPTGQLSFAEIGSAAMLSRATAGLAGRVLLFVLPGSTGAVRLAMDRLILPELAHMLAQVRATPAAV
jgi:molybdopterin biosynthesis enzyme MoaB